MANTADILGEQETLDGLVAHTLENFEDDRITTVRNGAFYYNDGLKSVNLPNATTVSNYAFQNCHNIESIKIPKVSRFENYLFSYCYKLNSLDVSEKAERLSAYCFERCYSLNNFDLSNITLASETRCLSNTGFGAIVLPNCTSLEAYTGAGARTSTIDLSKLITISANKFKNAYSLVHLILRRDAICPLTHTSAFENTPIGDGLGWIYVPTDLVDSYKTETNWSTYANQIVSIDEYPKALGGETITDTWDEIFQAEDNDTYKTKYNIGDTKYLVIGGTYVLMQIVAFDRDILSSDGASTAKITWLAKSISFDFPMNFKDDTTGGWAECECRKFLNDIIYEQIPENVRNKILAVNKTYMANASSSSTTVVSDKLWIPSFREMFGGSSYENNGIDYTDFFTDASAKIKHYGLLTNYSSNWWLRSVVDSSRYSTIGSSGTNANSSASSLYGIVLGFCT